jgi:hypothetical protein
MTGKPLAPLPRIEFDPRECGFTLADDGREDSMTDDPKRTLVDGSPVTADHRDIDPATGMQKGYVVLSEEERAKGYVRPVRRTYTHLGALTDVVGNDGETVVIRRRMGGCGADTIMGHAVWVAAVPIP